jgi:hypothetical protein
MFAVSVYQNNINLAKKIEHCNNIPHVLTEIWENLGNKLSNIHTDWSNIQIEQDRTWAIYTY